MTIPARVCAIISEELGRLTPFTPGPEVTPDSQFADLDYDSLDAITIEIRLEEEFGIDLSDRELSERWTCVADVIRDVEAMVGEGV